MMPAARWRLALMLLLCGLAGLAGVQPHVGDTASGSQTLAQWEHLSQGITSDRLDARFGARAQDSGRDDSSDLPGADPSDLSWLALQSTVASCDPVLTAVSLPDPSRVHLLQPLKFSPQAPRAPPTA